MRRLAIALHRIKSYDGKMVIFEYHDKTEGKNKRRRIYSEINQANTGETV